MGDCANLNGNANVENGTINHVPVLQRINELIETSKKCYFDDGDMSELLVLDEKKLSPLHFELEILKQSYVSQWSSETQWLLEHLLHQNYFELILSFEKIQADAMYNEENVLNKNLNSDCVLQGIILSNGLLNLYIQKNYTGGPSVQKEELLLPLLDTNIRRLHNKTISNIVTEGEGPLPSIQYLNLLHAAHSLLNLYESRFKLFPSVLWWEIRLLFLLQRGLEEKSKSCFKALEKLINKFNAFGLPRLLNLSDGGDGVLSVYFMEIAEIYSYYYDVERGKKYLRMGMEMANVDVFTTGVLGKRTKYQQTEISQLVLEVNLLNKNKGNDSSFYNLKQDPQHLPISVVLEDEDRLDKLNILDESERVNGSELNEVQHMLILAEFNLKKKYLPHDAIFNEELLAYLRFLIENPKVWSVQMTALLHRSLLESDNRRTVERSMKQLEILQHEVFSSSSSPKLFPTLFYGISLPLKIEIELSLSKILFSLHLYKECLEICTRLGEWDEVIECYVALGMRHRAEEVIREQLELGETPKLWIVLGDATDDESCYERAWKLSGGKSARAQRQWGYFYFKRKQYEDAIPHLQKSLELNPLENPTWIRLGFSALSSSNWELCTKAYQHSSALDGDNFEIWNNLGHAFIKMGEKKKALRALKEAIKCNYENWKVWENILVVGTDCRDFNEVLRAYNRLIELKGKWVDEDVLECLTAAIITNIQDSNDTPCREKYFKKTLLLFGRITATVQDNAKVWKLYSDLLSYEKEGIEGVDNFNLNLTQQEKSVSYLQKSIEVLLSNSNWSKTTGGIENVLELTLLYINRLKEFTESYPNNSENMATRGAFTIKRIFNGIKKTQESALDADVYERYLSEIKEGASGLNIQF